MDKYPEEENLGKLMKRAVLTAAQKIGRQERRNPSALRFIKPRDDDHDPTAYIIDNAAPTAEPIAPDPYTYTATRETIERAAKDDTDRKIIAGLALGYSAREIAQALHLSHTAINKRIGHIRDKYNND